MEAYKARQAERAKRFAERNKAIRQGVKDGVPLAELGRKYLIKRQRLKQIANIPSKAPEPYQHKRAAAIVLERLSGLTFAELAQKHGVSKERIRQIYIKAIHRQVLRALKVHGVSEDDKRKTVSMIVWDRSTLSVSQISTELGVPRYLVYAVRAEMENLVSQSS
jgi:hypothetical protein